ncbi:YdcF family protein [Candidatus Gracilibacteria bacterium]|nr:YdcF family protein [Candidatus Gracilibacteria bacterium]
MKKFLIGIFFCIFVLLLPWIVISFSSKDAIYTRIDEVPKKEYGLLLGTSPTTADRKINRFFTTRIEATKELYERGKIKKIIVSGAKNNDGYNEPLYMKNALIRAGVLPEDIILDNKGFRTLDSILRAKKEFKISDYIVISQPFHLERAIFLARMHGEKTTGFGAADIPFSHGSFVYLREVGARWKAIFDVVR